LPANKRPEERYRESVLSVTILVDEACLTQRVQHLVCMTAAERLGDECARALDDLLDGELPIVVIQARYDLEEFPLAVGGARPPAGELVGVELA
jgi:hypothetical protein